LQRARQVDVVAASYCFLVDPEMAYARHATVRLNSSGVFRTVADPSGASEWSDVSER